jgi:hypothetical protein
LRRYLTANSFDSRKICGAQGATVDQTLYMTDGSQEKAARPAAALQALGFD